VDENHFRTSAVVAVSDQFLSWIMAFDDGVKIVGPERVLKRMKEKIRLLNKVYKD
jgi:predicted nucleic acid-binding protein